MHRFKNQSYGPVPTKKEKTSRMRHMFGLLGIGNGAQPVRKIPTRQNSNPDTDNLQLSDSRAHTSAMSAGYMSGFSPGYSSHCKIWGYDQDTGKPVCLDNQGGSAMTHPGYSGYWPYMGYGYGYGFRNMGFSAPMGTRVQSSPSVSSTSSGVSVTRNPGRLDPWARHPGTTKKQRRLMKRNP